MKLLKYPRRTFDESVPTWLVHDSGIQFEPKAFSGARLLARSIASILQQVMMQVDLYRTGLGASAAQRTGIGQMLPILQPAKMRRDHRPNRAGIGRAVGVAANVA